MKIKTEELTSSLLERTRQNLSKTKDFNQKSLQELNWKDADENWSALECIEHLNLYSEFYLNEIENRIRQSNFPTENYFKSGIFGNYFAKSMLPKENFKKMNTFKDKNPIGTSLDKNSIQQFASDQQKMIELIEQSKEVSLNKTRVPISVSRWIKLKLGDVLRVVVYHNQRHLVQAEKMLKNQYK